MTRRGQEGRLQHRRCLKGVRRGVCRRASNQSRQKQTNGKCHQEERCAAASRGMTKKQRNLAHFRMVVGNTKRDLAKISKRFERIKFSASMAHELRTILPVVMKKKPIAIHTFAQYCCPWLAVALYNRRTPNAS